MASFSPDALIYQNLDRVIIHGDLYFLGGRNISFEISRLLKKKFLRLSRGALTITDDGEIERDICDEQARKDMQKAMRTKTPASYTGSETAIPAKERQRRAK